MSWERKWKIFSRFTIFWSLGRLLLRSPTPPGPQTRRPICIIEDGSWILLGVECTKLVLKTITLTVFNPHTVTSAQLEAASSRHSNWLKSLRRWHQHQKKEREFRRKCGRRAPTKQPAATRRQLPTDLSSGTCRSPTTKTTMLFYFPVSPANY